MKELIVYISQIVDLRQERKVQHKLPDIVVMVLFATLAYADTWEEIELFSREHVDFLKEYLELENGIPSHDTIQRVMAMISPEVFESIQGKWHELMNRAEGEKIKKIICVDGKTMRGSAGRGRKANHIVSAWCDEDGFCLGEKKVEEKTNEIKAIPQLLDMVNISGNIVTIDAMGTQVDIAAAIKKKRADYVLSVKENQPSLYSEVSEYLKDVEFLEEIKKNGNYLRQAEKSHNQYEIREYYQTDNIKWMHEKTRWTGIKSIGCVKKTIKHSEGKTTEVRYYISSLKPDIAMFAKAVRQHWSVEVMHWHLDVTFKEDANKTIEKNSAQNMNIVRKWCLAILKIFDAGKKISLRSKRFMICNNPEKYLRQIMEL